MASYVCLKCLHEFRARPNHLCPECGESAWGRVADGAITELSADSGAECQRCGRTGVEVRFAKFRWVLGLVILDQIRWRAGYYCRDCIRREFFRSQGLTLLFGWWGVIAFLVRNPISIAGNVRALSHPPLFASEWGAIRVQSRGRGREATGALLGPRPTLPGSDRPPSWLYVTDEDTWPEASVEDAPLCAGSSRKPHDPVATAPVADPLEATYRCPTCGREHRPGSV